MAILMPMTGEKTPDGKHFDLKRFIGSGGMILRRAGANRRGGVKKSLIRNIDRSGIEGSFDQLFR